MSQSTRKTKTATEAPPMNDLVERVGLDVLQRLQDRFAELGKVTVCITTVAGRPITTPTWGSRFSQLIGTSALGSKQFTEAVARCAQPKGATEQPSCNQGMTLYAAPIEHDDTRLGFIVAGSRSATPPSDQTVQTMATTYALDADELRAGMDLIDPYRGGNPQAIRRFADVLADNIATLFDQAKRIERQLADLRVVHDLSHLLAASNDPQEILDQTVARVVDVMPVKASGIRLLDEESGELVIRAVCGLSSSYLNKGPVMLSENSIDHEAFGGESVYIRDAPNDPRIRYREQARREGIVSGLCVPMTYQGRTIGVIRVYTDKPYEFKESEESLLRSLGAQAAASVINSRLFSEQARAEQYDRQVEAAGQIQRRMLPTDPPEHDRLEFGCLYEPTLKVGGDFFDFIKLPQGRLGLCIADVVGKGMPAALMMASVRSALRVHARQLGDVAATVSSVNRHMSRETLTGEFATMFYGVFSKNGRELTYCNAGHPPAIVRRDGRLLELSTGGLVIGIDANAAYDQDVLTLETSDLIVMTTDGVTEAMDFAGQPYGTERLRQSIERHEVLEPQLLAQQLLWDVRRFVGLADQSDDITIVTVRAL